ncbi:MAG: hypothetical protein ABIR61_12010 [Casimicrobiaceae bacterium]
MIDDVTGNAAFERAVCGDETIGGDQTIGRGAAWCVAAREHNVRRARRARRVTEIVDCR